MLTACYMVDSLKIRDEFKQQRWTYELDPSVQPLDAPEIIAAGSYVNAKAISHEGSYPLPSIVCRYKEEFV